MPLCFKFIDRASNAAIPLLDVERALNKEIKEYPIGMEDSFPSYVLVDIAADTLTRLLVRKGGSTLEDVISAQECAASYDDSYSEEFKATVGRIAEITTKLFKFSAWYGR